MEVVNESSDCVCSNMKFQSQTKITESPNSQDKYFHEIGAEMLGNQLIIRIEKDKNKKKKKQRGQWDPPCDCEMVEIRRPSGKEGPKIINAGDNNQILFRIHSKGHLYPKDDPNLKPQAIAYKLGPTKDGNNHCQTITVHPQIGGIETQEVVNDHISEENEDIFLLRIKKKNETSDQAKRNIEVELRTPKPPPFIPPPPPSPAPEPEAPPPPKEETPPAKSKPKKGKKGKGSKKKK